MYLCEPQSYPDSPMEVDNWRQRAARGWNSDTPRDIMPIITPCYPANNAAFNVYEGSLEHMKDEFRRGAFICGRLAVTHALGRQIRWSELWDQAEFFNEFKTFVRITAWLATAEQMNSYEDLLMSRIRKFAYWVEEECPVHVVPNANKWREAVAPAEGAAFHVSYFLGLRLKSTLANTDRIQVDLSQAANKFLHGELMERKASTEADGIAECHKKGQPVTLTNWDGRVAPGGATPPSIIATEDAIKFRGSGKKVSIVTVCRRPHRRPAAG